mgnify:FL=1
MMYPGFMFACISIHAPRTGSDTIPADKPAERPDFNPRSPHGERLLDQDICDALEAISIHAPRTGSDVRRRSDGKGCTRISIHAPRTGSDTWTNWSSASFVHFNPRSPHGERQGRPCVNAMYLLISIHAPRTGSDIVLLLSSPKMISFQSTLPARGATAARARFAAASAAFQSTLPARGATLHMSFDNFESSISIHAPRTGSDADPRLKGHALDISIHAPRTGSDCVILSARGRASISIHAPRTGSDDYVCIIPNCPIIISIHAPRTGSDTRI